MPAYTETLQLIKPTEEEFYNVSMPNANMDALDGYIRELREQNALLREELANKANIRTSAEYELELEEGFSAINQKCVYSKDSFGLVNVNFKVEVDDPLELGRHTIAWLPEGFRPAQAAAHTVIVQAVSSTLHQMKPCALWAFKNGSLIIAPSDNTGRFFAGTLTYTAV